MSPQPAAPPAGWDEDRVFQATFVSSYTRPEDTAGLRWLAKLIATGLEYSYQPPDEESFVTTNLRPALGDLRYLQDYLAWVGWNRQEFRLEPEDVALSAFAGELSRQVGELAGKLEARLAALPAREARRA